jgi:hypothetical protein
MQHAEGFTINGGESRISVRLQQGEEIRHVFTIIIGGQRPDGFPSAETTAVRLIEGVYCNQGQIQEGG